MEGDFNEITGTGTLAGELLSLGVSFCTGGFDFDTFCTGGVGFDTF